MQQPRPKRNQSGQATVRSRLLCLHPFLQGRIVSFLAVADLQSAARAHPTFKARFLAPFAKRQNATRGRRGPPRQKISPAILAPGVADPHTLLARLNTRRLYQRIKYCRQQAANHSSLQHGQLPFAANKTTEQIAVEEWRRCVQDSSKEDDDDDDESGAMPPLYELLLFSPCPRAVTVLASYPRSGNSLLRTLFERTTLRVTGSDMRGGLTKHDLVGEAAVAENMVQFVKTHYPERLGQPAYQAARAVLLVRNPYDAIDSYFNLMMTGQHTDNLTPQERVKHETLWKEMVLKEIQVWKAFHQFWLSQDIPLLVIRYEDLIRYTDKVSAKMIQFVLEVKNMAFFERRVNRCIRHEQIEKLGSYKPRSGGIGKSLARYSPELLQQMNVGIERIMELLGYSEMLNPDPTTWKLEPLDEFGVDVDGNGEPIMVNTGKLCRGAKTFTDWRAVRSKLDIGLRGNCQCAKCLARDR